MSTIDEIMVCADRFAAESIEYSNHTHVKLEGMRDAARYNLKCMVRDELAQRDEEIAKLRARLYILADALEDARRDGGEAMREAAAKLARKVPLHYGSGEPADEELAQAIEDLPLPTGGRQAVLLTDEQVAKALAGARLRPEDCREDGQIMPLVRAIEAASFAVNNLGVDHA